MGHEFEREEARDAVAAMTEMERDHDDVPWEFILTARGYERAAGE